MNHEINLTGYTATCGEPNNMLDLGTAGSYGLEKLHVTADAAWNGLTITATFTNSGSTTVAVSDGAVDVPPEATRLPTRDRVRYGMLAFKGVDAQGKLRIISTPIYYKVQASAATDGSNTIAPTPDQYAQFVAEVTAEADRAEAAANRAESAGSTVTPEQIAAAVNNYLTKNPVQATPIDATLTQSGQAADAAVVGNRLSALSEEIAAIPSGADGKSAYQYAVDGGYTGTETEFAEKMAQEKFANPNALTFTGAATGTYDGSAPLEVAIPSGGGSSDSVVFANDILAEGTVSSGLAAWSTVDTGVTPQELRTYKSFAIYCLGITGRTYATLGGQSLGQLTNILLFEWEDSAKTILRLIAADNGKTNLFNKDYREDLTNPTYQSPFCPIRTDFRNATDENLKFITSQGTTTDATYQIVGWMK